MSSTNFTYSYKLTAIHYGYLSLLGLLGLTDESRLFQSHFNPKQIFSNWIFIKSNVPTKMLVSYSYCMREKLYKFWTVIAFKLWGFNITAMENENHMRESYMLAILFLIIISLWWGLELATTILLPPKPFPFLFL